jgi:hypothetical protein
VLLPVIVLPSVATGLVAALVAFLDPAWAPTLNTALVCLLAVFQARQAVQVQEAKQAARDAKRAAGANNRNHEVPDTGHRRRVTDK